MDDRTFNNASTVKMPPLPRPGAKSKLGQRPGAEVASRPRVGRRTVNGLVLAGLMVVVIAALWQSRSPQLPERNRVQSVEPIAIVPEMDRRDVKLIALLDGSRVEAEVVFGTKRKGVTTSEPIDLSDRSVGEECYFALVFRRGGKSYAGDGVYIVDGRLHGELRIALHEGEVE